MSDRLTRSANTLYAHYTTHRTIRRLCDDYRRRVFLTRGPPALFVVVTKRLYHDAYTRSHNHPTQDPEKRPETRANTMILPLASVSSTFTRAGAIIINHPVYIPLLNPRAAVRRNTGISVRKMGGPNKARAKRG